MRKISEIIIHHTATPARTTVEQIKHYHVQGRGWSDIGYHYLIESGGRIRLGRPVQKQGAHCRGRNKKSIGVSVIGNFEEIEVPDDQFAGLTSLLKDLARQYPKARVSPHSYYANTLCPGKNLLRLLA